MRSTPSAAGRNKCAGGASVSPNHAGQSVDSKMTGMRVCTWDMAALADVVRMAKVRSASPSGLRQPSQRPANAIRARDGVGRLAVRRGFPLVECVGRNDAAAAGEGVAEHAGGDGRFSPGIDGPLRGFQVLGEMRHQAPAQQIQPPLAGGGVPANDHRGIGRCQIPVRADVGEFADRAEQAGDFLGRQVAGVASAHAREFGRS
jgi:hypothetical protein